MAGTTVHDENFVADALVRAFATHQLYITRQHANRKMGIPKPVAIRELLEEMYEEMPADIDKTVNQIHNDFRAAMLECYRTHPGVRSKEHAEDVFRELKNIGITVALDTGFSRDIADAITERLGWSTRKLVDMVITSDEVKQGRPAPDMIFRAMELAGVQQAYEVAKIGDTVSDLEEGTSAGCRYVIGITSGAQPRHELEKAPHTHLVDNLKEVLPILI